MKAAMRRNSFSSYRSSNSYHKDGWLLAYTLAFLMLFFFGCKDKAVETPMSSPDEKPQKIEIPSDSPGVTREIDAPENYSYNPLGKPDPFMPFISEEKLKAAGAAPLESLEVGQLTLVAVITGGKGPLAMVEDASGKGYILRPGSRVGTQEGIVTSILADRVVITEKVKDFSGKIKKRPVTLELIVLGKGEY